MSNRHWWLVGLGLVIMGPSALAQNYRARYVQFIEPRWLRLQLSDMQVGVYAEGTYEQTSTEGGQKTTFQRVFVGPALSLGMQGSLYHPNFCSFSIFGEGAYGWAEQMTKTGNQKEHNQNWEVFGNYSGTAQILPDKPVNGTLFSSYGRSYREYDFFTRATVDALSYGSRTGYQNSWLELLTTYTHTDENVTGTSASSTTGQDLVNFGARNDRGNSSSSLNYTFNQFTYSQGSEITDHIINLSDNEQLSSQVGLGLGLTAAQHESGGQVDRSLSSGANLGWTYDPQWSSDYSVSYDRFDSADLTSQTYFGQAGVQHQLYESLSSALNGNASVTDSTADNETGYNRRYGGIWTENYSKVIGANHRLHLNGSLAFNRTDQKSTGRVVNESQTFPLPPAAQAFTLNQLNVDINTIVITDAPQLITYIRGLDYEVFVNGSQTEIRRLLGGTIPQGATVLVDYEAEPTPAGSYETYAETVGIRLDLWNNLWSLYARLVHVDNNAPSNIQTLSSTAYAIGTDVTWQWLHTGVEYNRNETSESVYWSVRAYQSGSFSLDPVSSLTAGFTESHTEYQDASRQEQNYSFTTTYHRSLSRGLQAYLRGGVDYRLGKDVEQTIAVFRPELNYNYGQTTIQLTYNFEYNLYLGNEERQNHIFTLRVRRKF